MSDNLWNYLCYLGLLRSLDVESGIKISERQLNVSDKPTQVNNKYLGP